MKRIMSVIFAIFMVAVCGVAGGVFLTGSAGKKDNTPSKEVDNSVSTTATGNWDSYYASSFAGGSGTSSSPYLISTPEQLARMSYNISHDIGRGSNYKLINNIDISAHYWTPAYGWFLGEFNGDDYTISGMTINTASQETTGSRYLVGLFGIAYYGAYIHNFSISKASINVTQNSGSVYASFVLATYAATNVSKTIIDNVRVLDSTITITSSSYSGLYMGGLVGNISVQREETLVNKCCLVGCTIYGPSSKIDGGYIGGLVGFSSGYIKILNSYFHGHIDVYSAKYGGGLVGYMAGYDDGTSSYKANLHACYYVDVSTGWLGSQYVGGLIGYMKLAYIYSCFCDYNALKANSNSNAPTKYIGALVGHVNLSGRSLNIYHSCWNSSSGLSSVWGYKEGTGMFFDDGNHSYTDRNLPKSINREPFFGSSSYLKGSYGGTTFDFNNVWLNHSHTYSMQTNKSYPILRGGYSLFYVSVSPQKSGRGYVSFGLTNPKAASNDISTKVTNTDVSISPMGCIYGQTITATASISAGFQLSNWTLNSTNGQVLSTGTTLTTIISKGTSNIYANTTGRSYTINFNSNGGMISDLSMWQKYAYGERFNSFSYNASTGMNTITMTGGGGWEIIGCPVTVSTNTSYTFTFDYQANGFSSLDSSDHPGLPIMVTTRSTGTNDSDADLRFYSLATSVIYPSSSSEVQRRSVTFNSGSNSTVYIVINFGWLADNVRQTIKIGNFKRPIGATFNMVGQKKVQYGSTTNNTLPAKVSKKTGYTQTGWYTAGSGGHEQYDPQGVYVSGGRNNYLSNLNYWTKYFGYSGRYSISYNGADSSKMSTFTCTGQGGWECVGIPLYVSQNTSYTFSFKYSAGNFSIGHHDGVALQVVPSVVDSHMEDTALLTSIITPNSSGTRTVSFNSGSYTTVYLVLNGGWFLDGVSCSVSVGKFEFTGAAIPNISNYYWTSDGKWAYQSNVTLYAQYAVAQYSLSIVLGDSGIDDITNPATAWNIGGGRGVAGGGKRITVTYGASQTISVSVKPGYTFSHWSDGDRSISRTITMGDEDTTYIAYSSPNTYTLTYNANGGTTPLSSTQIAFNDYYGKKNFYDASKSSLSGPISRSGNIFTISCNNTSGGWQWGNFIQRFSGDYQPNTKYTVVYECLSFSGSSFGITLTSPDDEGSSGNTDISNTGQCHVDISGVGIYTSTFTTKSSFNQSNLNYDFRAYTSISNGSNVNATFRVSLFVGDVVYNSFSYASCGSKPSGNVMPTPTRSNYTFAGWWTAPSGGTQITPSSTYNTVGNQTLYAHWTPNAITNKVYLRMISKNGNSVSVSNAGGSVSVLRYLISGSSSSASTTNQTAESASYTVHQGQQFKIMANANSGYVFAGFSTSSTPSASIKNPSAPVNTTATYYPTSGTNYYVYFKQLSGNLLKYDETDKYFYFEDGYYPQSRATNEGTLNSSASATGETINYNDGRNNVELSVYSYGSDRFVKVTKNGTSAWFKFEPIRWRISDYGVEKTERNIERYKTLLNFRNYTSYATNFTAVSDLILGVGAMHNTRSTVEGTSVTSMAGYQNVRDTLESCSISFGYAKSDNIIKVDSFSTYSQNNTVYTTDVAYTSPLRIASLSEIENVGFANKQARASDMVAFILGVDKNNASYWTRDLSNLGSGVAITASGTVVRPWLDQMLGMRFAYTFSEGSNVGF